jgi:signal peptidase II
MNNGSKIKKFLFPLVFMLIFLLDRASKLLILNGMPFSGTLISFVTVHNAGAAFGLLQGQRFFLAAFSFFAIFFIGYYVFKKHAELNLSQILGLAMICGGSAGNLFDRVGYGYVIDFIQLNFVDFPVFNVADVFINLGVALVLIGLLRKSKENCVQD